MSAGFYLVPRMESGEFLDLIYKVIEPLSVLALKGVQIWCSGRGCSPIALILIN